MKKNKIELNLLSLILLEATILLFFFQESLINILVASLISTITFPIINKIKDNKITNIFIYISTIIFSIF